MKRLIKGRQRTFPSFLNLYDRIIILFIGGVFTVLPIVKLFLNY